MSELKCPFCQQELKPQTIDGGWLECWNCSYSEPNSKHLPQPILCGSRELWQELIRTRKALKLALKELKQLKYGGKADRTYLKNKAGKALEQIKELDNAETHI